MEHLWKMSSLSHSWEAQSTCLWQILAWLLLLSFPVAAEGHWLGGYVAAAHSCTMLAACLPLAVIFCMRNPNRRHRDPSHRAMGPGDMAVARMVAGAAAAAPPPPPNHEIVYPQGFHGRGLPISAVTLISKFLPALRIRRMFGEDDIITPMIPPLYFLLSERMVVRMLAGLKGEGLITRRLHGKQPGGNMVVPMSAIAPPPRPEPDMPVATPLLSALVPQDALGDRFWDIDFLILPLRHHSLNLFSDFWVLGGSSLRGTTDFPEGLELATYPYTLRAVPVDGDCRMLLCIMFSLQVLA